MQSAEEKNQLQIALLGPPLVRYAGQSQTIGRHRTRAVLYYLACQPVPVTREKLCGIFWPNAAEKTARKNLREILSHLRSQFSEIEFITSRYDQLSLNSDSTNVDVQTFQSLIDRVHFNLFAAPTGKLPESLYRELREGMGLWRTPRFMDGFAPKEMPEFERWMSDTGTSLQRWRQIFVERLADHNISSGNLSEAMFWLWQAVQIDPLKTDLHYLMLTSLRDSGKADDITNYMDQLVKIYQTDHGMDVPQVLVDFINRSLESKKQSVNPPAILGEKGLGPQPTFVGRKEILQQLAIWSLRGGITFLEGESGIGKSSLMLEFYNRIDHPIRSVFCAARPMEQNLPFQPFVEGLRAAAKPEDWQVLSRPHAEALIHLFPEIAEVRSDIQGEPQSLNQDSYQPIFDAILDLLQIIAGQKRLVIFFDDAHWSDEASIFLLSFLSTHGLFQKNGFLLLTSRIEVKNSNLEEFIHSVERRNDFQRVKLEYLTEKEVGELIYLVLGKVPPPEMVAKLIKEVGGNPLFLHQTLKLVMDYSTNLDALDVLRDFPMPHEVQVLIRERLDSLNPDARAVANICAVIGTSFTPGLVEDICKLEQDELVQILEQLVNMHLLSEVKEFKPAGGYAFSHEKIRESIIGKLSPARKRMLNLQVADALERCYGKPLSLAVRYAQYHEAAGELKAAYFEWIQAAQYARQLFSRNDAYFAYQKACDLVEQNEALFVETEIHELITKWGNYAYDIDDKETSETIYQKCLEMGLQRQSSLLIGTGQSGLARALGMRYQIPSALKHMKQALKILEASSHDSELIEAYTRQGDLYHISNDYRHAREFYEKAVFYTSPVTNRRINEAKANAQGLLSILYAQSGWTSKAIEMADQCIESSQNMQRASSKIQAYTGKAMALFYSDNYREAVETGLSVLQETNSKEMAYWSAILNSVLSKCYLVCGHLDKAWQYMEDALKQSQDLELPYLYALANTIRGDIYRHLNHFSEAEKEFSAGTWNIDFLYAALENMYKLGTVKLSTGDRANGYILIEQAWQKADQQDLGAIGLPALTLLLSARSVEKGEIENPEEYVMLMHQAQEYGFKTAALYLEFTKIILDHPDGLPEPQLMELKRVINSVHATSNVWLELDIQMQILASKNLPIELKRQAKVRITSISDALCEYSTRDPVREMVKEFTGAIERSYQDAE